MQKRMNKLSLSGFALVAALAVTAPNAHAQEVYTVQKGDTLWSISIKNQVSLDELREWNNLSGDGVYAGQILRVSKGDEDVIKEKEVHEIPAENETPEPAVETPNSAGDQASLDLRNKAIKRRPGMLMVDRAYSDLNTAKDVANSQFDYNKYKNWYIDNVDGQYFIYFDPVNSIKTTQTAKETTDQAAEKTENKEQTTGNYTVKAGDYLYKIANQYGVSVSDLKKWNNLTSDLIYPGNQLTIKDTAAEKPAAQAEKTEEKKEVTGTYTVKSGDSLWAIANRNGVSVSDLKKWNNLTSDLIYPGSQLTIKGTAAEKPAAQAEKTEEKKEVTGTYTVKSGDSLWAIANRNGVSVSDLKKWNNLTSDLIYPGNQLTIKGTVAEKPAGQVETKTENYVVQKGDYLYKIANKYGVTVQNLKDWNGLTSDFLQIGDVLKVKKPASRTSTSSTTQSTPQAPTVTDYKVKAGDTLWQIAIDNKVSVKDLKDWNNITGDTIYVGQGIKIAKPATESNRYTVKKGDYLYKIAKKFNTTVNQLKAWNGLTSDFLQIGDVLRVK